MKPVICIPSYSRPNGKAIERCKHLPIDKYIFIRPEEKELYSVHKPEYKLILQRDGDDIGKVRRNIMQWCYRHGIDWVFMFDDDTDKIEEIEKQGDRVTSKRILYEPDKPPRFELSAMKLWYKLARQNDLSLSVPLYRPFTRGAKTYGYLTINGSQCIQCILAHVPDIMEVGNYKSTREIGAEDMYMQYLLMKSGYKVGSIGLIEFNCPSVGVGKGGNNANEDKDLNRRYETYVKAFLDNVCDDPKYILVKSTKTGLKSIKFNWKNWDTQKINLLEE